MRLYRTPAGKEKGIALVIALFTVFAILTMGVTYIGISFTNSRASAGYEKEAVAVAYANAGIDYAIYHMGDPHNWDLNASTKVNFLREHLTALDPGSSSIMPKITIIPAASDSEFNMAPYNGTNSGAMVIVTQADLKDLGFLDTKLYGHWRILVMPESEQSVVVSGEAAYTFNINYRVIVRARIMSAKDKDPAVNPEYIVSSREVLARLSNEFPGSIYQNIRSYDIGGGYHYPNREEYTDDAVFVCEDFNWDGAIKIDGPENINDPTKPQWAKPQVSAAFNVSSGWVPSNQDFSGSINLDLLNSSNSSNTDIWPKFYGKAIAQKSGKSSTASSAVGIQYHTGMKDGAGNFMSGDIFKNTKDPYETGASAMNIHEHIWKTSGGTEKLSYVDASNTAQNGFFYNLAKDGSTGASKGWFIEVADSELRPDLHYAGEKIEAPTYRITTEPVLDASNNPQKTKYTVQKFRRDTTTGEFVAASGTDAYSKTFYSDDADFKNIIYVKGGNVQVVGKNPNSSEDADGNPGKGHLTAPVTIVADSSSNREADSLNASQAYSATSLFDQRLTTCNVYDTSTSQYVFQCYKERQWTDANGTHTEMINCIPSTEVSSAQRPIWSMTKSEYETYVANPTRFKFRYPPYDATVNEQPEGNLEVVGDLVYRKDMQAPSLGLLAKNHVLLNDYKMPKPSDSDYIPPTDSRFTDPAHTQKQTLEVTATIGSKNHSMTMDFFNMCHNPFGKPATVPSNPPTGVGDTVRKIPISFESGQAIKTGNGGTRPSWLLEENGQYYVDKWTAMTDQGRTQINWDFNYGALQLEDNTNNSATLYQGGIFKFTGCIISRFADVEADAGFNNGTSCMGYHWQKMSYDTNLKNRSAPFFSTACYNKAQSQARLSWSILSFVDKGAISETKENL
ncbi:MAG: hypothetical protein RDV48_03755 [Candidatus Eremiobacteraeota bacterium]|nr:hypothetical protein [Candidatus Eremiobacteraeota bacterium]